MFNFLELIVRWFLIIFLGLYFLMCFVFRVNDTNLAMGSSAIFAGIMSIIITTLLRASDTMCPKCNKKFAMKEISRKTVDSRITTIDIDRKIKNSKGEVIRTYTEAVPATRYFYDCVDECKFCGHKHNVRRDKIVRD